MVHRVLLLALVFAVGSLAAERPGPGLHARLTVSRATRHDWTFAVANRSLPQPPADWLGDYDSTKTTFDLFVPAVKDTKQPLGLVVYIAADNNAGGAGPLIEACKGLGLACAAVREAGNNVKPHRRVRMALDVLDEVRSRLPIDPDRTYLAGFSGGARVASKVAYALPEVFAGVLSVGASEELRDEPYLRLRCVERLSVALVVGEKDFNRAEAERFKGPLLKEVGVRSRVQVVPGQGHAVPNAKALAEALRWLDEGTEKRRALAKEYPASRVGDGPPRAELAQALFDEGKKRLEKPATVYGGLMQLKGCLERWPDLQVAEKAKEILLVYEEKKDRPWEDEDVAEQRKYLVARVRGLTAYATGDLPPQYAELRPRMAAAAVEMWELVVADGKDAAAVAEAKKRLPELKKLAEK